MHGTRPTAEPANAAQRPAADTVTVADATAAQDEDVYDDVGNVSWIRQLIAELTDSLAFREAERRRDMFDRLRGYSRG